MKLIAGETFSLCRKSQTMRIESNGFVMNFTKAVDGTMLNWCEGKASSATKNRWTKYAEMVLKQTSQAQAA